MTTPPPTPSTIPSSPGLKDPSSQPNMLDEAVKPQGLKSSPGVSNPHYEDLGFNPVPGDSDTVRALHKKLADCAKVLEDTHGVVTKLMDGSRWEGDAAVAFREQIQDGPLPLNLKNAAHSIRKAARQLNRWHDELDDFQGRAKRLNRDAKEARAVLAAAEGRAEKAGNDPDLDQKKAAGHDDAKKAQTRADGQADDARDELERVLRKARQLAGEHEEKAGYRAGKIRDATKKLVPKEPGWLESVGDWIAENLPDILAFVAGVIGLVALILAGPLSAAVLAALLLTAGAFSAGAFLTRMSDPVVWESLRDGFTKGERDADFWGNVVSLGADFVGSLPGVAAVSKGGLVAASALGRGGEAVTLGQRLAAFGTGTMNEARAVSALDNPLLDWVVRGAPDAEKAGRAVELSSASLGVVTGGYGIASSLWDAVENDGAKDGATGVDGARFVLDGGSLVDLARHLYP